MSAKQTPSPAAAADFLERVEPDPMDPEYANRPGYQSDFLGFKVPFPALTNVSRKMAYAVPGARGNGRYLLKYYHYSIIFNAERKLAFVAGVNFDPTAPVQARRDKEGDKWFYDPRVQPEKELQAGEALYKGNPLDRGHLVRRADAGWGADEAEAKLSSDDTFHFTNCSPQHEITNQGRLKDAPPGLKLWGRLEDYVATEGLKAKRKLCVFNGPVFSPGDVAYRGVKLPREFWKVVIYERENGQPGAAAFLLTQADLIKDLREAVFDDQYQSVQVRVRGLAAKTGLNFGAFGKWDVLEPGGSEESAPSEVPAILLHSVEDVRL